MSPCPMKAFQRESTLKGTNLCLEEQILSLRVASPHPPTRTEKGLKNHENVKVASPESISIPVNCNKL